jgi:phage shock protein PspC (stress-responsive transcriptional regulator)
MSVPSDSGQVTAPPESGVGRRLYRSKTDRMVAGVAGGLGEYFAVDPVWFRIAFVVLTVGGGAGLLIYLVMWIVVQPAPGDYVPSSGAPGRLSGAIVVGIALIVVGAIALVNTIAPSLGQYFWPVALLLGGLALVMGGVNRDNDR